MSEGAEKKRKIIYNKMREWVDNKKASLKPVLLSDAELYKA